MPYLGYFRLLLETDIFVIYDCVQFTRRGWIHRNKLKSRDDKLQWLTLPLINCDRNTLIKDVKFRCDSTSWWEDAKKKFPALTHNIHRNGIEIAGVFYKNQNLSDYLTVQLKKIAVLLNSNTQFIKSSDLNIHQDHRGQDRIIKICEKLEASIYINSPGGTKLYNKQTFEEKGIKLIFLPEWEDEFCSSLEALAYLEQKKILEKLQKFM